MVVWSDISKGSVVVAPMEGVIVMCVVSIEAKEFIAGWRSCGGFGITVLTPSWVVVT